MFTAEYGDPWIVGAAALHFGIVRAIHWSHLPKVARNQFCRNGCHGGWRGIAEAQVVFKDCIPYQAKIFGEGYLKDWMAARDFGHIQARANGGGYQAKNIVMEKAALNRARGGRDMTPGEVMLAQVDGVIATLASRQFLCKVAGNAAKGAVAGAVSMGLESALRNIWNASDGEISWEKAAWNTIEDAKHGAAWGAGIAAGVTVATSVIFPLAGLFSIAAPLLTAAGVAGTTWNVGSFIWGKLFSDKPKVSLLVRPRLGELLVIPNPLKLILPEELKLEIPERKSIILPPQKPLVTSLEPLEFCAA
jgi:hypothetical protein